MCQYGYNTLCCYYHPKYTYDLDPTDSVAGNYIRFWFGIYLDEWIWYYGNVELWYLVLFPTFHLKILITNILAKSWIKVFQILALYSTKVGCVMADTG